MEKTAMAKIVKENFLVLTALVWFVVAGIIWHQELINLLSQAKENLFSGLAVSPSREPLELEPVDIAFEGEKLVKEERPEIPAEPKKMSLDEIKAEIERISAETEMLTLKVNQHVEEEQRLAEIQTQIEQISLQIQILSQKVNETT